MYIFGTIFGTILLQTYLDRIKWSDKGYGYSLRFQIYLKNEKRLTVDAAAKELDIMIQKDPPKTEEGRKAFDSLRPFSKRTVHRL